MGMRVCACVNATGNCACFLPRTYIIFQILLTPSSLVPPTQCQFMFYFPSTQTATTQLSVVEILSALLAAKHQCGEWRVKYNDQ